MYLVCKFKDGGELFITTRKSREVMLSVLQGLGQEIESIVLKEFETYNAAMIYKKQIEDSDITINKIISE